MKMLLGIQPLVVTGASVMKIPKPVLSLLKEARDKCDLTKDAGYTTTGAFKTANTSISFLCLRESPNNRFGIICMRGTKSSLGLAVLAYELAVYLVNLPGL